MAITLVVVTVLVVLVGLTSVILLGLWIPEAVLNGRNFNLGQWSFRIGLLGGLLWLLFSVFGSWVP